jgi:phage/plasmid-associated DNA primase
MNDGAIPSDRFNIVEEVGKPEIAPAFSDEALALRFAERHASDLRFVAAWSKWLSWAETHWRPDDTLHAFDRARQIVRGAAAACNKPKKVAAQIASARTVAAVERLSRAGRRLAATDGQWDDGPDIINTPRKKNEHDTHRLVEKPAARRAGRRRLVQDINDRRLASGRAGLQAGPRHDEGPASGDWPQ